MALGPGQVIGGRYRLVSRLGSGGMADVWLADDEMLNRKVALKFLHERFAQDTQFVERFRREAQSAAGLQHPNIVGVYDRGETDGRHWIAMEYVEGASLADLIARGLSVGEAVEIVRQILVGVRFAHSRGIVHRDLKPQNVLVDPEGRARVTDFGIARAGVSEITATGSVLGTAQYLSPEQAQGLEVTAASDLYSVGVILYEALTGRVPFEADSPVAVALKQVSEQPRRPSEVNPRVPPALDGIVLKALAKDPQNRYASADEFLRALEAAEVDPDGSGLGQTAAWEAVGAGAAAGAAAGALGAEAAAAAPPTGEETVLAPTGGGWWTRRRKIAAAVIAALLIAGAAVAFALTRETEQVTVPAVTGKPLSDAQARLQGLGFDVAERNQPSCQAQGTVVEQDPLAATKADKGSTVVLTVSQGVSITIPTVRNLPQSKAREKLEKADLQVTIAKQSSKDVKAGHAITTDPPPGTEEPCKSPVTLIVSRGPNLVTIPSVLGESQEVARSQLENLGLIVNVDTTDSDEPQGTVVDQDPVAGTNVSRDDRVTIVVSNGAGTVVVPDVIGQPKDTAISILKARGLAVQVVEQDTDNQSDDKRVLDQAPSSGNRARRGDLVTIFVGNFVKPEPTTTTSTTSSTTSTTTTTP
ncbi:MAG: Stk1 family PASTA domain-containing Ser/Thr kinase [Solirubrobacterales bacterium]